MVITVPGRVNLIGEHIDYHDLPVLPMAIPRCIRIEFKPRSDRRIRAGSAEFGEREVDWTRPLTPGPAGDWANYVKAAARAVDERWNVSRGIDAEVSSDLPPAAGLSSSSALLVGFTLALLRANGIEATFEELMEVLPDGEQFVGTRGGGMDHAAVLASRAGSALLVRFAPLSVEHIPAPPGWEFLVAHSLTTAEKSGPVRAEYNSRRQSGARALERLGFPSFRTAFDRYPLDELERAARARLDGEELRCFLHVVGEAFRVETAAAAMRAGDIAEFARMLDASHRSLRDLLRVSSAALDELVEAARDSGALGARLTGAGFGGCAVVLCPPGERDRVAANLVGGYYSRQNSFDPRIHLIAAEPSAGALNA
jgi:galactokinase